jgi:hypothetical protein
VTPCPSTVSVAIFSSLNIRYFSNLEKGHPSSAFFSVTGELVVATYLPIRN